MADNFEFTPGAGKTGAADEIGGVLYPRVKLTWGADGTANDADTASGKALPVQLRDASGNAVAPLTESTFDTKIGSLTETAPASDTASSGLNGRLQRIAQRISSLIAVVPAALTGSGNFKVSLQESNASQAVTGTFWQATQPVSLASVPSHAVTNAGTFAVQNTAATPAGTNLIGKASVAHDTSAVYDGTTALTPKFAAIAASSSGNNTVIAAVNPKKIRVLAVQLVANGAVNAKWQSGASGTDLTGLAYLAANGGYVLPYNPVGWFETASNTLLNLNLSGAVAVGGSITYVEV